MSNDEVKQTKRNLFFIIGSGRCGTTLLRTILCTHKDICIPCETHFYTTFKKLNFLKFWRMNSKRYKQAIQNYKNQRHVKDESLDWDLFKRIALDQRNSWDSLFLSFLTAYRIGDSARIVGEKTPGHVRRLIELKEKFSDAKFIHIIRDPRAVVASYKRHSLYKDTYGENIIRAISKWKEALKVHFEVVNQVGENYYYLHYEDLVQDAENEVKKLCRFLDINFEERLINEFTKNNISINNQDEKNHEGINKPIYTSSINAWESELTDKEVKKIEYSCEDYMDALNYEKMIEKTDVSRLALAKDYIEYYYSFVSFVGRRILKIN